MKRILSFLKEYKQAIVALILVAIIADILFITFKSDPITFTILGLSIVFFKFYKFSNKSIFALCFIPIVIIFFGFIIDPTSLVIEKASIWLFLLMGVGILQEFFKKDAK